MKKNIRMTRLRLPALAATIVAAGAVATYSSTPWFMGLALPAAVGVATLLLCVPPMAITRGRGGYGIDENGASIAVLLALIAAGAVAFTIFNLTATMPHVDATESQSRELSEEIAANPERAALLRDAAADGRIDMREIAEYRERVDALRRRKTDADLLGAVRTAR